MSETESIYDRAIALTARGEALCALIKAEIAAHRADPEERAAIITDIRDLVDELEAA